MAIEFVCPACGGTLQVGDDQAGRVIRCGGCLTTLRVPAADAASSPTTDSAPPSAPASPFEVNPPAPPPPRRRSRSDDDSYDREERPTEPRRRRRDPDDPYDDRPRRSRRRPPPPAGRGVFFWLVILGGIMLFLMAACCGGMLLMVPGAKWRTHESKQGGFKVELPADPKPNIEDAAGLKLEQGTHAEGTVLFRRVEHFLVIYRDIPSTSKRAAQNGETDEQIIERYVNRVLNATDARTRPRGQPITVQGFPGRELLYQGKGGFYRVRIIVADSRLYIVMAGGPQRSDSAEVQQFIDSFEITDPKLVDEGKRREEQAKLAAEGAKQAKEREEKRKQAEEEEQKQREADDIHRAAGTVAAVAISVAAREALNSRPPVAPPPREVGD